MNRAMVSQPGDYQSAQQMGRSRDKALSRLSKDLQYSPFQSGFAIPLSTLVQIHAPAQLQQQWKTAFSRCDF